MVIILEGPDKAGKTTAAKEIQKLLSDKHEIIHFDKPDESFDFENAYLDILDKENIILDRFYYSEVVYSKLLNRECKLNQYLINKIEKKLRQKNAKLIFVNPGKDVILERLKEQEDPILKDNMVERSIKLYKEVLRQATIPVKREI